ncbi:hypothetical protein POTOM_021275 [Populus tomentosa]|uniref:Uncharacterized protein n=1 Tax=Populus tomentosa TaxID=118781 RepID=A0A8X8CSC4_POPTO|nr:hypothetical protein POTOM_021275 [Populus tomentosa]
MGNCPGSPLCCPCPAFSYFSLTYNPCLRSRCHFARHSSLAINSHLLHDVAICEADSKPEDCGVEDGICRPHWMIVGLHDFNDHGFLGKRERAQEPSQHSL